MKYKDREEFIFYQKIYGMGMIKAYKYMLNHCKTSIETHKTLIRRDNLEHLADMNNHLWKEKVKGV